MTSLDWVLAAVLAASTIAGLMSGFARVVVGLAAGIFAVLLGFWFYRMPAAWFAEYFESKAASSVLGFLVIFLTILILGGLLGRLMSAVFKWAGLSWLDRLLGGALGFARGFVAVAGMVAVLTAFAPTPAPQWMAKSEIMPYALGFSKVLAVVAPRDLRDRFDQNFKRAAADKPAPLQKETY
ncbi:hypothetical protein F183_A40800 [Bryobacterales bacterium F-183]|nr:hypothetical protein F183_A40800 [Bryobacterales bacterium F-183]